MSKKKSSKKTLIWIGLILLILAAIAYISNKNSKDSEATFVEFDKVKYRNILETVAASGKVYPEKEVKISSDVSGEVVELYVMEGDTVKKGQLLAKIDPDNYVSAVERGKASVNNAKAQKSMADAQIQSNKAQKQQIEAQLINARNVHKRNQGLYNDGVISQVEYEQSESNLRGLEANLRAAEASLQSAIKSSEGSQYNVQSAQASLKELQTNLRRTTIVAPNGGIVSSLSIEKGERVVGTSQMSGTEMMRIANLESMLVKLDVSENDILNVALGDSVDINVDAYPSRLFKGKVTQIANSASNISTTTTTNNVTNFEVEVRIAADSYADLMQKGRSHPFRPGMSASVEIYTDGSLNTKSVPIQAVTTRVIDDEASKKEYEEVVFAMQADTAVKYTVTTGIQDDEYIQITSTLPDSLKLISGPYSVVSEKLEVGDRVAKKIDRKDSKKKWGKKD